MCKTYKSQFFFFTQCFHHRVKIRSFDQYRLYTPSKAQLSVIPLAVLMMTCTQ